MFKALLCLASVLLVNGRLIDPTSVETRTRSLQEMQATCSTPVSKVKMDTCANCCFYSSCPHFKSNVSYVMIALTLFYSLQTIGKGFISRLDCRTRENQLWHVFRVCERYHFPWLSFLLVFWFSGRQPWCPTDYLDQRFVKYLITIAIMRRSLNEGILWKLCEDHLYIHNFHLLLKK